MRKKQTDTEKKRNNGMRRGLSIRWRLLLYFAIFILFMLLVLWVFQIRLLHPFYERIKGMEMTKAEKKIEAVLEESTLESTVYQCALDYSTCIEVWKIEGTRARLTASADISGDCIIHHVSGDYIRSLYEAANKAGGKYSTKIQRHSNGLIWIDSEGRVRRTEFSSENQANMTEAYTGQDTVSMTALFVSVIKSGGAEYVILLDSELTPMSATVSTLKAQFSWIVGILFGGALLLAYLLFRRISNPLVRMNNAASQLAQGKYDVHFSGNGYRETRELAQTLNFAAEELSKTDRLQKELIANISHDLRTPLTMIKGYSEIMRDLPGENTPENVQVIIDETTRLSELVNDLLDLSRIQAGTRHTEMEVFNLTEIIRSVMKRYEKLVGYEGYTICFEAEGDVSIKADRNMMLQVIYNLINNAINYCGEDRAVFVKQIVGATWVRICVCDHGVGIPPEQIPLIWDRYYKVDRVHRRAMIGTGLGLSIVKSILELHKAQYGVDSRQGEHSGSVFWFELPTVPMEMAVPEQATAENTQNDHRGEE